MSIQTADYVIIGAGIFGMYAAQQLSMRYPNARIYLLEYDGQVFGRASYINQARVHNGYHYPRSLSTARKSAEYYNRFCHDFSFAVNKRFEKIYAISDQYSYASAENFEKFCIDAGIPYRAVHAAQYLQTEYVSAAYITEECTLDAQTIAKSLLHDITNKVNIIYHARIKSISEQRDTYTLTLASGETIETPYILNATYASTNAILALLNYTPLPLKYELTEICLTKANDALVNIGLTIMDGPFFSVMPFGDSGYHSLTAVHYTPHLTSRAIMPGFACQEERVDCSPYSLANCNHCPLAPKTAYMHMYQLAKKYLHHDLDMTYARSLYTTKTILAASEVDDARPTVIRAMSDSPRFYTVLSGKINTVYDLDEILHHEL